jgi:hypothetical protein
MPDTNFKDAEVTLRVSEDYRESEDFVPNPADQTGTVDTSGTGGMANSRIEEVTPIFDLANKQDRITAARALDPDDDEVTRSHVVMPTGQVIEPLDKDEIIDQARRAATKVADEDVVMGGPLKTLLVTVILSAALVPMMVALRGLLQDRARLSLPLPQTQTILTR